MKRLLPEHLPQLLAQPTFSARSSYVALASAFGNSRSELDAVLAQDDSMQFVDDECAPALLLSLHAVDRVQGHARVQLHGKDERGALPAFLQRLSSQFALTRLYSYVFPHETTEIAQLRALGFVPEACFRQHLFVDGAYADLQVFGLVTDTP
ncbi:GNAT family N-acetyltransferase [Massilia sp. TSP1-1-2]|uniref:GNAT family N-acetyltransferase n=1 Tax=Massilia sp. TSP1-1-2 TaxID=2804649 RepID=UPI003CEB0BEB